MIAALIMLVSVSIRAGLAMAIEDPEALQPNDNELDTARSALMVDKWPKDATLADSESFQKLCSVVNCFHDRITGLIRVVPVPWQDWVDVKREVKEFLSSSENQFDQPQGKDKIQFLIECLLSCKISWLWRFWLLPCPMNSEYADRWLKAYESLQIDFRDFEFDSLLFNLSDRTRLAQFELITEALSQPSRRVRCEIVPSNCLICDKVSSKPAVCHQCLQQFCQNCLKESFSKQLPPRPGRCPHCRAVWVPFATSLHRGPCKTNVPNEPTIQGELNRRSDAKIVIE